MEIKAIVIKAFCEFGQNKISFFKNFLPSIFALIALGLGLYAFDIENRLSQEKPEMGFIPLILVAVIVFLVFLAKSIVHTHRTFILSEKASIKELFTLTRRDFRFIKKFIALNLVMLLIGMVILVVLGKYLLELAKDTENEVILFAIGSITTLMTAFVWSRLAIVLPSAALDQPLSIQSAWKISDDHSAKLFIGVGLLPVLTDGIISYLPSFDSHFYSASIGVVWCMVAIIEIGVLSLIYKDITENQSATV
jgi:hypothetical protein